MPWFWLMFLLAILDAIPLDVRGIKLPNIYWNSSNPIFRIDNTDHIIDVQEYDRVDILCPNFNSSTPREKAEYYIIYNVSKEEYETCRITNVKTRKMVVCDKPFGERERGQFVTLSFRPFSPVPNGPQFHQNKDYYFISTSSGDEEGLSSMIGGSCHTHHMKLIFKVHCSPAFGTCPNSKMDPNNNPVTPATTTTSTTISTTTTTTTTTTAPKQSLPFPMEPPVDGEINVFLPTKKPPYYKDKDTSYTDSIFKPKSTTKKQETQDNIINSTGPKDDKYTNGSKTRQPSWLISYTISLLVLGLLSIW